MKIHRYRDLLTSLLALALSACSTSDHLVGENGRTLNSDEDPDAGQHSTDAGPRVVPTANPDEELLIRQRLCDDSDPLRPLEQGFSIEPYRAELPARLARLFWDTEKPAALSEINAALDENAISTSGQVACFVKSFMLSDPRADSAFRGFYASWLELGQDAVYPDPELVPEATALYKATAKEGLYQFALHAHRGPESLGKLSTLLTLDMVFGARGPISGNHDGTRVGVFTQPYLLIRGSSSAEAEPSSRGLRVLEALKCRVAPPPPQQLGKNAPLFFPGTAKAWYAEALADPSCTGCHTMFDPPGFALETFDALGKSRTTHNGEPIDPSGTWMYLGEPPNEGTFTDAASLMGTLAADPSVHRCFASQVGNHLLATLTGVQAEPLWNGAPEDGVADQLLAHSMSDGEVYLNDLFAAFTTTTAFYTDAVASNLRENAKRTEQCLASCATLRPRSFQLPQALCEDWGQPEADAEFCLDIYGERSAVPRSCEAVCETLYHQVSDRCAAPLAAAIECMTPHYATQGIPDIEVLLSACQQERANVYSGCYDQHGELARARQRWHHRGSLNYNVQFTHESGTPHFVEVRDGEVTDASPIGFKAWSIPALFDEIERALDKDGIAPIVSYDPEKGFPIKIGSFPEGQTKVTSDAISVTTE